MGLKTFEGHFFHLKVISRSNNFFHKNSINEIYAYAKFGYIKAIILKVMGPLVNFLDFVTVWNVATLLDKQFWQS